MPLNQENIHALQRSINTNLKDIVADLGMENLALHMQGFFSQSHYIDIYKLTDLQDYELSGRFIPNRVKTLKLMVFVTLPSSREDSVPSLSMPRSPQALQGLPIFEITDVTNSKRLFAVDDFGNFYAHLLPIFWHHAFGYRLSNTGYGIQREQVSIASPLSATTPPRCLDLVITDEITKTLFQHLTSGLAPHKPLLLLWSGRIDVAISKKAVTQLICLGFTDTKVAGFSCLDSEISEARAKQPRGYFTPGNVQEFSRKIATIQEERQDFFVASRAKILFFHGSLYKNSLSNQQEALQIFQQASRTKAERIFIFSGNAFYWGWAEQAGYKFIQRFSPLDIVTAEQRQQIIAQNTSGGILSPIILLRRATQEERKAFLLKKMHKRSNGNQRYATFVLTNSADPINDLQLLSEELMVNDEYLKRASAITVDLCNAYWTLEETLRLAYALCANSKIKRILLMDNATCSPAQRERYTQLKAELTTMMSPLPRDGIAIVRLDLSEICAREPVPVFTVSAAKRMGFFSKSLPVVKEDSCEVAPSTEGSRLATQVLTTGA